MPTFSGSKNIPIEIDFTWATYSGNKYIPIEPDFTWTLSGSETDLSIEPDFTWTIYSGVTDIPIDIDFTWTVYSGIGGIISDVTCSGGRISLIYSDAMAAASGVFYEIESDLYAAASGTINNYITDVNICSGNAVEIYTDIKSSIEDTIYIPISAYGSEKSSTNYETDIIVVGRSTYNITSDIICASSGTISGAIDADIYSSYQITTGLDTDAFAASSGIFNFETDVNIRIGTIIGIYSDVYAATSGITDSVTSDIRLASLELGEFFLGVGEITTASAVAWVDIIDKLFPIDLNNSYFLINNQQVNVTFSGITPSGIPYRYRMYHSPSYVFGENDIIYTAHVSNSMGDVLEQDYHLTYSYHCEFNDVVDWGANNTVIIDVKASNLAFCPNTEGVTTYFKTKDLDSYNLGASINPVGYVGLGAAIKPQNTFFFYGRTYTITISNVKDYSGNELDPVSFTFTIEDS